MEERAAHRDAVSRAHRRRWLAAPGVVVGWMVLTVAGVIPGCLVPPALMAGGGKTLEQTLETLPTGTEAVEVELASGERLRGVFVPAGKGAPVVLHLLESSGSVVAEVLDYESVLESLTTSGFASLMLDYRGVGASDGDRTPRHLAEDARAMWAEARRRAGGDEKRVVVRAISIGAIPAAILAEDGARPAAWILIAPVRAETVVRRFAAWQHPGLLPQMACAFFRPVADVDLIAAVRGMREPVWVVSPKEDVLLAADEQTSLREAVEAAGGKWTFSDSGHEFTTLGAHDVWNIEEAEMLVTLIEGWPNRAVRAAAVLAELPPDVVARFPEGSAARLRLAEIAIRTGPSSPEALAAGAFAFDEPGEAARILRQASRGKSAWLHGLRVEEIERILDMDDPGGDLPVLLVRAWANRFRFIRSQGEVARELLATDAVLDLVRSSESEAAEASDRMHDVPMANGTSRDRYPCCELWRTARGEDAVPASESRRRVARVLLKAASIPERVVQADDGTYRVEVRENGRWRRIALDWPEPRGAEVAGSR